jgi:hypothetical protein
MKFTTQTSFLVTRKELNSVDEVEASMEQG